MHTKAQTGIARCTPSSLVQISKRLRLTRIDLASSELGMSLRCTLPTTPASHAVIVQRITKDTNASARLLLAVTA
jgi:hypothetical protein